MKDQSIKKVVHGRITKGQHCATPESNMIITSMAAAAHSNVSPVVIEQIIALAWYTLFLECEGAARHEFSLHELIGTIPMHP